MSNGPLSGFRIIEMESIGPVPFCGMHLADLGAEVVLIKRKIAGSAGDLLKGTGDILNRGKKIITLNLKDDDDIKVALDMISNSDAVIEGMRPGVMERLGLGPNECMQRNERLVYGRLTGWGQEGPLSHAAGHDLNYIALSSAAWYAGDPSGKPLPTPALIGDVAGGAHYLMIGVLSALLQANSTGKGDVIDAAMVDGSAHMMNILYDVMPAGLMSPTQRGQSILDGPHWYNAYACSDGKFISIGCLEPAFYKKFLKLMDLQNDPAFQEQYNKSLWPQQVVRLTEIFLSKPQAKWCDLLEGTDACFAPILNPEEAVKHPHNVARDIFINKKGNIQANLAPRFKSMKNIKPNSGVV